MATQRELRERNRQRIQVERDEASLDRLRIQFLQTALSYCGVPYARRYHEPECECVCAGERERAFHHLQLPRTTPLFSWTAVDW